VLQRKMRAQQRFRTAIAPSLSNSTVGSALTR
jgi:hypothetical protein